MQLTDSGLFFSPSDLNHFVECEHLTSARPARDRRAMVSRRRRIRRRRSFAPKGFEHEQAWLQHLRDEGKQVVEIAADGEVDWAPRRGAHGTRDARRRRGHLPGRVRRRALAGHCGFPDPRRHGLRSSAAGATRPATPSSRAIPKPYFILQLCWYTEQLARLQGLDAATTCTSSSARARRWRIAPADFLAYYRAVRARFMRALVERARDVSVAGRHCHVCGYASHCEEQREADDHLSLVAGMRRDQVERLERRRRRDGRAPGRLRSRDADRHHAADARPARASGAAAGGGADRRHRYELLQPEPKRGFGLLPAPSTGDIFFDIEGYPFFESSGGLEYLWGVELSRCRRLAASARSSASIARARSARSRQFIDFVHARLEAYPGPARLSLRRLRDDARQAADGGARDARGGGRRPAAARRVRRSLSGRAAVDADLATTATR